MERNRLAGRFVLPAIMVIPVLVLLGIPSFVQATGQTPPKKQAPVKTAPKKKLGAPAPKAPAKPADPATPAKTDTPPPAVTPEDKGTAATPPSDKPAKPAAAPSGPQAKAKYVGPSACAVCHDGEHKSWLKKTHAGSYDLLVARKAEKNPECIKCHTTGYGRGGYVDAEKTPELKGVTCEACHGPGSEHNGEKETIQRVPPATVCTDCHMKSSIH